MENCQEACGPCLPSALAGRCQEDPTSAWRLSLSLTPPCIFHPSTPSVPPYSLVFGNTYAALQQIASFQGVPTLRVNRFRIRAPLSTAEVKFRFQFGLVRPLARGQVVSRHWGRRRVRRLNCRLLPSRQTWRGVLPSLEWRVIKIFLSLPHQRELPSRKHFCH